MAGEGAPKPHQCGSSCRRHECQLMRQEPRMLMPDMVPMPRPPAALQPPQQQSQQQPQQQPFRFQALQPSPETAQAFAQPLRPSQSPRSQEMLAMRPLNERYNGPFAPPTPASAATSLLYRTHRPWFPPRRYRDWQQYQYMVRQQEILQQQQEWLRSTVRHGEQRRREQDRLQDLLMRRLEGGGIADPPLSDGNDSD